MFKNLCYNASSHEWQYHRRMPTVSWTHVGTTASENWEDPRVLTEFNGPVSTSSGFNEGFRVKAVNEPIQDAVWVDGLAVYRQALGPWANAIGHMYAEYLYPIFHAMDVFGLVTRDVNVLMRDTPCRGQAPASKGNKCAHFHDRHTDCYYYHGGRHYHHRYGHRCQRYHDQRHYNEHVRFHDHRGDCHY